MIVGFLIWSIIAILLTGIGIWTWNSKGAAGFFAGVKPPEVKDIKKYNHAVAILWFAYAIVFELFGIPLLFYKQNPTGFVFSVLGVVFSSLGLAIGYHLILSKYGK